MRNTVLIADSEIGRMTSGYEVKRYIALFFMALIGTLWVTFPRQAISAQVFQLQTQQGLDVKAAPVPTCSLPGIVVPMTINALREQLSDCREKAVGLVGLTRINAAELPPPGERFQLQAVAAVPVRQGRYEVDLYFDHGESYMPDASFERLDKFIQNVSRGASKIASITLVGKGDVVEGTLRSPSNVGLQRANHVLKYLRAAGLSESVFTSSFQVYMAKANGAAVIAKNRSVWVQVIVEMADEKIPEAAARPTVAGRRPGDLVAAAAVPDIDLAIEAADRIKEQSHLPLRTEDELKDESIRKEVARLKFQLRERLAKDLFPTDEKTAGRLMVDVNSAGMVQQAWIQRVDGPLKLAERAMNLALATPSLGPLPEEVQAIVRRIVFSVGWTSDPPPKPGTVQPERLVPPVYPLHAKKLGQEGKVLVRVQVLSDGRSGLVEVASSSGSSLLDSAAIEAMRFTYFFPTHTSEPLYQTIPLSFLLQSDSFEEKVRGAIKPYIMIGEDVQGNPRAVAEVDLAPDGRIVRRTLSTKSGSVPWDTAVLNALDKAGKIPLDANGKVPPQMLIGFQPKD